jgi:hypothetical protein
VVLEQRRRGKGRERIEEGELTGTSSGGAIPSPAPTATAATSTVLLAQLLRRKEEKWD